LELKLNDGRVRQGDAVTTYKAQGASKMEMIRVENNRSLAAMANRSLIKDLTARDLESQKTATMIERIEEVARHAACFIKKLETVRQSAARRRTYGSTKKNELEERMDTENDDNDIYDVSEHG